jgi:hypothetical protein
VSLNISSKNFSNQVSKFLAQWLPVHIYKSLNRRFCISRVHKLKKINKGLITTILVVIVLMIVAIRDIAFAASTPLGYYKSILTDPVTHCD